MTKRKIFALAIIIIMMLFAGNVYAQEAVNDNHIAFGLGALIPIDEIGVTVGPGLQFSWYNPKLFTGFMGLGVHLLVHAPIVTDNVGLVISLIAGPEFTVLDTGKFVIPITAGLHFDAAMGLINKAFVINLGIGAVGDFEWHFNEKWYAYGRLAFALNFGAFEFLLMPGIGMGFSF